MSASVPSYAERFEFWMANKTGHWHLQDNFSFMNLWFMLNFELNINCEWRTQDEKEMEENERNEHDEWQNENFRIWITMCTNICDMCILECNWQLILRYWIKIQTGNEC